MSYFDDTVLTDKFHTQISLATNLLMSAIFYLLLFLVYDDDSGGIRWRVKPTDRLTVVSSGDIRWCVS